MSRNRTGRDQQLRARLAATHTTYRRDGQSVRPTRLWVPQTYFRNRQGTRPKSSPSCRPADADSPTRPPESTTATASVIVPEFPVIYVSKSPSHNILDGGIHHKQLRHPLPSDQRSPERGPPRGDCRSDWSKKIGYLSRTGRNGKSGRSPATHPSGP